MSSNQAQDSHNIPVESEIADLLCHVAQNWIEPSIRLSYPIAMQWGDENFDGFVRSVSIKDHELVIICQMPDQKPRPTLYENPLDYLNEKPLKIVCSDGRKILCRSGYSSGYRFTSMLNEHGKPEETKLAIVKADEWKIVVPHSQARLWVGIIEPSISAHSGNLTLQGHNSVSSNHFRLHNENGIYYILRDVHTREGDKSIIAIQPNTNKINMGDLFMGIKRLAFSFGQPIRVVRLHGLDVTGRNAGAIGGDFGANYSILKSCDAPIPTMYHDRCWIAPFFRSLCNSKADENGAFDLALYYYIDSLSESLMDGRVLKRFLSLVSK